MKKIIIILLFVQSFLSCAQTTYPLNTNDVPDGSYIQDINNEFLPYLGAWEATWNNKKITLYLTKLPHVYLPQLGAIHYYEDIVVGKYRVIDLSTGAVLEDTTGITNIDNITLKSISINRTKNFLRFQYYTNQTSDCKILSYVLLYRDLNNPNILTYKYYVDSYNHDNCPYTNIDDIPVNIPKQEVVLHKL